MKQIFLIDSTRNFLDSRPAIIARSSKEAVKKLNAYTGTLDEMWIDNQLGYGDDAKPLLDYLALRAKIGSRYPVQVIFVHTLHEPSWQVLNAKLSKLGYPVFRASVRDTLG